jgi:hypothetical protein
MLVCSMKIGPSQAGKGGRWGVTIATDKEEKTVRHRADTDEAGAALLGMTDVLRGGPHYLVGDGAEVLLQPAVPVAGVVFHRLELYFVLVD